MSFDRLAPYYGCMERFLAGDKLHRCRTAFLAECSAARSVLLVGEGHGRFLVELCKVNYDAQITYLDASPGMAAAARKRLVNSGLDPSCVRFRTEPIGAAVFNEDFDLLTTHFFLDCFPAPELEQVVGKLARHLRPGGVWLLADFAIPSQGWRKWRARVVLRLAYTFFRVATRLPARDLVAPADFLERNGLVRLQRREFNFQLLYAELWRKGTNS